MRVFGPNREEVTGGWRKLHNEELHNLYSSLSIIRMTKEDEMDRACSTNGEKRNAYRILLRKPEETTRKTQDVCGWIILKWILDRMGWYGLD
jgi:hypothetical protein